MSVMMSWARSTLANLDHRLGRDQWYDRILVGVMILLALAIVVLFTAAS